MSLPIVRTSVLVTLVIALFAQPLAAATYTVTSPNWDGAGSLNEAIGLANANPGPDTIEFTPEATWQRCFTASDPCRE